MDTECLPEHVILVCELNAWQARNPDRIFCEGRRVTKDGRLVFDLSISDTKFRLLCPDDYPNHEDSFLIETECIDFWFIALNEFIVDYPGKLMIDDILAKAFLYYTPSSRRESRDDGLSETDDDSDGENDYDRCANFYYCTVDSESSENSEWESVISKKKKEWREKEGELRLRYNRPKISDMFDGVVTEHPQQVFSNSAASAILINDLIDIMGNRESSGIVVEPIESDICRWSVLLEKFALDSCMAKDLSQVKELYGYEHVQLQLDFAMDLYPFHPPLLQLVKPKLIGLFDGREFVQLANWNPARNMASVLKEIKDYIEANGAVDIHDRCNGVNVNELQIILTDLNDALKSDPGKASDAHLQSTRTGIEYSSWISPGYCNPSRFSINSRKRSVVIETILTSLLYRLKNVAERTTLSNSPTKAERSPFTFHLSVNNDLLDENNVRPTSTTPSYSSLIVNAIHRFVENEKFKRQTRRTSLNQKAIDIGQCGRFNCNIITNPSFDFYSRPQTAVGIDVGKYSVENNTVTRLSDFFNDVYTAVTSDSDESEKRRQRFVKRANDVISTFDASIKTSEGLTVTSSSNNSTLGSIKYSSRVLKSLEESNLISLIRSKIAADGFFEIWLTTSLHSIIIEILIEIARNPHLIDLLKPTDAQDRSIADLAEFQGKNVALIVALLSDIADGRIIKQADLINVELAKSIIHASKYLVSKFEEINHWSRISTDQILSGPNNLGINDRLYPVDDCPETIYRNSLKHLQFRDCDIDPKRHAFENEYKAEINSPRNYFRIAQEFAFLSKTLPLSPTPAIFVIMDKSKCSLMRALIIGAEGTCCSGGCFNFDIYLRKDYPDCRMKIKCTTFCGEELVEQPESGTVFLPLEGDILDPDPGFGNLQFSHIFKTLTSIWNNEFPLVRTNGRNYRLNFGNMKVTDEMNLDEVFLTNIIRCSMINQMRNPSPGFEEVVKTHFLLSKDRIISELIGKYEFLTNSELLHVLIEEFNRLQTEIEDCSCIEKKSCLSSSIQ